MPQEDIPSMLQMVEEKIASSKIEVRHRDILIRLKHILEEDMEWTRTGTGPDTGTMIPSVEQQRFLVRACSW
jgi:hypothetical protein